jgi:hypothetical protein
MRKWRNSVMMMMKGQKEVLRNKERTIFINPFYFQIHTSQNEIKTPELLCATLHVSLNPLLPFARTLKNMYCHRPQTGVLVLWCVSDGDI